MSRFLIFALLVSLGILGCSGSQKETYVLAKVNSYEIGSKEFNELFKESPYVKTDTTESKMAFLSQLIDKKLILQDAQRNGLDKDPDFLRAIERFWEQSLLKLALEKKSKEIAGLPKVTDKSIEEAYQKMVKEGKTSKPYAAMYQQIKWEVTKLKESQAFNDWLEALRRGSEISINYDLLNQDK